MHIQWMDCKRCTVYMLPSAYSPCFGASLTFPTLQISCLQVIHSSIGVLTIILQQHKHQMPSQPRPLGMTIGRETSRITYYGQHVIKEVPESMFTQMHWSVLTAVYTFLLKRHGPQASQGLIRPMANPQLKHNTWRVKLPLGSPFRPRAQGSLQNCVRDVLLGLQALHAAGFVHCDIRLPNIIEVSHTSHSLAFRVTMAEAAVLHLS